MELSKRRGIDGTPFDLGSEGAEEHFLVDMFAQIADRLREKYNYSDQEIFGLSNSKNEFLIPIVIFAGKLSPAEALSKFLKEKYELSYSEISELIGRDERSVWANYKRAARKMPWPFEIKDSVAVPISIFNSEISILEALVTHLKEVKKLRNKKIAQLLNKNTSNIWTVYNRAQKKFNGHKNESQ